LVVGWDAYSFAIRVTVVDFWCSLTGLLAGWAIWFCAALLIVWVFSPTAVLQCLHFIGE